LKVVSGLLSDVTIPVIPGHEIAGEIFEIGDGVKNVKPGDRVAVYLYMTCDKCYACRQGWEALCSNLAGRVGFNINGGYAEFMKVPSANVLPLPPEISFEEAACLDPVTTPYNALVKRVKTQPKQTLGLIGVGGLGLHALQVAKALSLRTIALDISEVNLEMAAKLGAEAIINSGKNNLVEKVKTLTQSRGLDLVLEMSGNPKVTADAFRLLAPRGKLIMIGYHTSQPFEAPSMDIVLNELEIYGSRAYNREDFKEAIEWVRTGKIKPIIQDVMPLSAINVAHEMIRSGQTVGRLVIRPAD
jgi:D-arabinose 1-dehydrogenase-like Zn-dependent alcohol dehydrogenase